jgi:hypothetical protein
MINLSRARALAGLITIAVLGCSSDRSTSSSAISGNPTYPQSFVGGSTALAMDAPASSSARAVSYADSGPVNSGDVIRWSAQGLREDIIIDRIERSPSVFHLTAADENGLRDKGVSEAVIQEMKATSRR